MAWNTYEFSPGDEVITPQGKGTVQRVSVNGYAQVKVDGQLFEVPKADIQANPDGGKAPDLKDIFKDDKGDAASEIKVGDKVKLLRPTGGAAQPGEVGEVKDVQPNGTMHVDFPSQKNYSTSTSNVKKEEGGDVPQDNKQGEEFKAGDRVTEKETGREGTVDSVTQRTVYVKYDDQKKGREGYYKSDAQDKIEKTEEQKKQDEPQPKTPEQQATDMADDMYGLFNLKKKLEEKIESEVDGELKELREEVKKNQRLEVKVGDNVNVVTGRKHRQLETLITYAGLRLNSLLVGMAGTGKTHASEQVAEALGLPFYTISVGAQTSKSDIIGYMDAGGNYVTTHFRKAYEEGGVFLMDEIDAGNANVLIQVNAALSNGYMSFPDEMVRKHKDFVFIASANTYGNGANRQYVGRNQLDAATLDRFSIIDWLIDEDLEKQLAVGRYGDAWHEAVRACRQFVADKNIRALISPRATQKGSALLAAGVNVDEVISSVLLGSVPEDKKADVIQVAVTVYNRRASGVPGEVEKEIAGVKLRDISPEELPF